jgi:hypothetical protein
MECLVRCVEQRTEGRGHGVLGLRQESWARRGRCRGVLEGFGGSVREKTPCGIPAKAL